MRIRRLLPVATSLLAACAAGPEFRHPAAPDTGQYTPGQQPQLTATATGAAGAAQRFVSGVQAPSRWWESFQCDSLNELVQLALAHSPTVLEARARVREADAELTAQTRSSFFPAVDAQLGATREKLNPAAFGIPNIPSQPAFTLYNAQVNVSYRLDLFGADRRAVEGLRARSDYQTYEAQTIQLTLAFRVVSAAIRQADLQAQFDYTEELLGAQSRQLAISEERYRVGGISLQDLLAQRSRLEQFRATLPLISAARQQVDHQLAVYTGKEPARAAVPRFSLAELHLPAELPLVLPSELVRRRPDVQASEALWHEAGAQVGVATANLFPRLNISASASSQRTRASDLVDGANVWSVGASLLQPIFHAGELRARRRSAIAAYDAAAQAYEQTVLESLQQVADSLRVLEADAASLQARALAAEQATASYAIAKQRFASGGISELSLSDAEQQDLQTELDRSRAAAQRLTDTAGLFQAVAGPIS